MEQVGKMRKQDEETIRQTTQQLCEGAISEACRLSHEFQANLERAGRATEESEKEGTVNVIFKEARSLEG